MATHRRDQLPANTDREWYCLHCGARVTQGVKRAGEYGHLRDCPFHIETSHGVEVRRVKPDTPRPCVVDSCDSMRAMSVIRSPDDNPDGQFCEDHAEAVLVDRDDVELVEQYVEVNSA